MSARPNFLIIGAGKSGTTSLWSLLGQHPEIFVSRIKEPSFFSIDEQYARGWKWYESLFRSARGKSAIGEASNSYSATGIHPDTVRRIVQGLPGVRLIYMVRNPFDRMESDWMETQRMDAQEPKLQFSEFVRNDSVSLDKTLYWEQISAYREHIPDARILPLLFEDFAENPASTLQKIYTFLGVDPSWPISNGTESRRPSGQYLVDSGASIWARRLPGFEYVNRNLSRVLVDNLRPLLTSVRHQNRPEWDESTRRWFMDFVRDDNYRFLEYAHKPKNFWNF